MFLTYAAGVTDHASESYSTCDPQTIMVARAAGKKEIDDMALPEMMNGKALDYICTLGRTTI